ncbi:MAG: shikimate dehydrogenase [Limnochordia bacterium]|mgnify:CR=1 FL=1|jgi:shikimate dehydrogenase|nr:shikimate dehydrogenase [Bacillota bacterium]NLH30941.1 shikimate dehydrogenase [Bacillota bacterium]HOB08305.1 shikimate dehydrogenase [Limnochordia bacterium]HPZ30547.1 shikimate dehydrogenase [Limnochordia bacterium]HQD69975.1 shikimate dehydrogenase [Limnochordia bacterium]
MELLGVIGNPIAHSLSPAMHQAALKAAGKEGRYLAFLVEPEELGPAVYGAKALGFTGLNVTIPFKEQVLPYLDQLTPEAAAIQSVNTIAFSGGRIIGHSTDGAGFAAAAKHELGYDFSGKTALVVGAGGAARAVVAQLLAEQCRVYITNRTEQRARALLALAGGDTERLAVVPMQRQNLEPIMGRVDVVINTTSVGMAKNKEAAAGHPAELELPIAAELLLPRHLVIDIIYNPKRTLFLETAEKKGCRVQNGVGMLVWQAVKAWEFWWGITPPVDVMYQAVEASLP